MDVSIEDLKRMRDMDIMDLKREELVDADDIAIDMEESVESRVKSFVEQAKNPYALNVGDYILQIGYMEGAEDTMEDRMLLLAERRTQITI